MTSRRRHVWAAMAMAALCAAGHDASAQTAPPQTAPPRSPTPQSPPAQGPSPRGQDGAACSNATLAAAYGFTISGQNYTSNVPWAFIGQFTGDGAGALSGAGTQSIKGTISRARFTGKYEVQADCSGTATLFFGGGPLAVIDFVIVDDGRELHLIVADQGVIEFGTAKRVRSGPPAAKPTLSRATPR